MKYYRVLRIADGCYFFKNDSKRPGTVKNTYIPMIPGELLTEHEKNQYCNSNRFFELVEVKKNNTYWFFGARFENGTSFSDFVSGGKKNV